MTPIVNPWIFYLAYVLSNISSLLLILGSLFFGGWGTLYTIAIVINREYYDYIAKQKPLFLKMTIISLIVIVISLIIPDKETIYQILAASLITPDNLEAATDIVDYIVQSVNQLVGN